MKQIAQVKFRSENPETHEAIKDIVLTFVDATEAKRFLILLNEAVDEELKLELKINLVPVLSFLDACEIMKDWIEKHPIKEPEK